MRACTLPSCHRRRVAQPAIASPYLFTLHESLATAPWHLNVDCGDALLSAAFPYPYGLTLRFQPAILSSSSLLSALFASQSHRPPPFLRSSPLRTLILMSRYHVVDMQLENGSKYSPELRTLCHIDAKTRLVFPAICPRCCVPNTRFNIFMTYATDKAGLWSILVSALHVNLPR